MDWVKVLKPFENHEHRFYYIVDGVAKNTTCAGELKSYERKGVPVKVFIPKTDGNTEILEQYLHILKEIGFRVEYLGVQRVVTIGGDTHAFKIDETRSTLLGCYSILRYLYRKDKIGIALNIIGLHNAGVSPLESVVYAHFGARQFPNGILYAQMGGLDVFNFNYHKNKKSHIYYRPKFNRKSNTINYLLFERVFCKNLWQEENHILAYNFMGAYDKSAKIINGIKYEIEPPKEPYQKLLTLFEQ